jgi:hypothetical protein
MMTRALSPMAHEVSMNKMGISTDRLVNGGRWTEPLSTIFTTDGRRCVNTADPLMDPQSCMTLELL